MSADELRGTSQHAPTGNVFGANRKQWKAVPVKQFSPKRPPISVKWLGFVGGALTTFGIIAIVFGLGLSTQREASGIFGLTVALTGLSMVLTGPLFCAAYHVAKAVLHIRDMTAHRHLGE